MTAQGETPRFYRALDFLRGRKRDYQLTFNVPCGERVLNDLAEFCRANETTFHVDERAQAMMEGRRQVFLRIAYHLNLPSEKLYEIFNGGHIGANNG